MSRPISLADLSPQARRQAAAQIRATAAPAVVPAPKRHKYGAQRTQVDGIWFPSKKEAHRYAELRLLEQSNIITHLRMQVRFPLIVNDVKISEYRADFVYFERTRQVVEDSKGYRTPEYRLKRQLMLAIFGIEIRET